MFWIFLAMTLISLIPFNPQKLGRKMHAIRRACSVLNAFQWVRLWDVKHPPSLLDAFLCLFCYGVFRKTRIVTTWVIISVRKRFGSHRKPPPNWVSKFHNSVWICTWFPLLRFLKWCCPCDWQNILDLPTIWWLLDFHIFHAATCNGFKLVHHGPCHADFEDLILKEVVTEERPLGRRCAGCRSFHGSDRRDVWNCRTLNGLVLAV